MTKKMGAPKKDVTLTVAERVRLCRQRKREEAAGLIPPKPVKADATPKPVPIQKLEPSLKQPKAAKVRKQRLDSATAMVAAMDSATKRHHMPPAHIRLPEGVMDYWFEVMETRSIEDWTGPELVIAANLCKLNVTIEDEEDELSMEDTIITDYLGNTRVNPRAMYIEKLHARRLALMRSLRMGGKPAGDARDLAGGRVIEGKARAVNGMVDESDGLLA